MSLWLLDEPSFPCSLATDHFLNLSFRSKIGRQTIGCSWSCSSLAGKDGRVRLEIGVSIEAYPVHVGLPVGDHARQFHTLQFGHGGFVHRCHVDVFEEIHTNVHCSVFGFHIRLVVSASASGRKVRLHSS